METRRWTNPHQPQTLQIAVFLLYFHAVSAIVFGGLFGRPDLLIAAGSAGAAYGLANEKRWAYLLAIGVAALPLVFRLIFGAFGDVIGVMFEVALLALLLHPQSRDYQRVWFS